MGMFSHIFQVSSSIFSVFLRSRGVLDAVWRHLGSVVKAFWRRPGASTECFPDLGGDITVSGHF